jgi:hypothetical protein
MAVKKPADALKAKQRKQKIFVAIGGVALLAAAAFEVPMLMKGSGGTAPPPPAETTAASSGTTGTPTSLAPPTPGAAGTTPVAGVGQLVDTDVPPQPSQSRLVGFSLFPSRDPFVQQVSPVAQTADSGSSPSSSSSSGDAATSKADKPVADVPPGESVVRSASPSGGSSGSGEATVQTVTISVNGKQEAVGKGGTFPRSAPTFRLVSFGNGTAEIGIVGGSYASGGNTITLKQGKPLTLVNTTDDTRYRIVLVRTP